MKLSVVCLIFLILIGCGQASSDTSKKKPPTSFNRLATSAVSEDYSVIEAALSHFSALKEIGTYGNSRGADLIILQDKTPEKSGMLAVSQMSNDLDSKNKTIPTELGSNLRKRNVKSVSLIGMKKRHKKVVVDDLDKYPDGYKFWDAIQKQHPRAKAWAQTWLPGYSKDAKQAVIRFWFGPTAHGATATYLLVKQNHQWKVKWHSLAFYA
jgi:hypothetical protein